MKNIKILPDIVEIVSLADCKEFFGSEWKSTWDEQFTAAYNFVYSEFLGLILVKPFNQTVWNTISNDDQSYIKMWFVRWIIFICQRGITNVRDQISIVQGSNSFANTPDQEAFANIKLQTDNILTQIDESIYARYQSDSPINISKPSSNSCTGLPMYDNFDCWNKDQAFADKNLLVGDITSKDGSVIITNGIAPASVDLKVRGGGGSAVFKTGEVVSDVSISTKDSPLTPSADTLIASDLYNKDIQEIISELNLKANTNDVYSKTAANMLYDTKANKDEVYSKTDVDTKLGLKQDKLTAGTNITITNNVISATGGGSASFKNNILLNTIDFNTNDYTDTNTFSALKVNTLYANKTLENTFAEKQTFSKGSDFIGNLNVNGNIVQTGNQEIHGNIVVNGNIDLNTIDAMSGGLNLWTNPAKTNGIFFDDYSAKPRISWKENSMVRATLTLSDTNDYLIFDVPIEGKPAANPNEYVVLSQLPNLSEYAKLNTNNTWTNTNIYGDSNANITIEPAYIKVKNGTNASLSLTAYKENTETFTRLKETISDKLFAYTSDLTGNLNVVLDKVINIRSANPWTSNTTLKTLLGNDDLFNKIKTERGEYIIKFYSQNNYNNYQRTSIDVYNTLSSGGTNGKGELASGSFVSTELTNVSANTTPIGNAVVKFSAIYIDNDTNGTMYYSVYYANLTSGAINPINNYDTNQYLNRVQVWRVIK